MYSELMSRGVDVPIIRGRTTTMEAIAQGCIEATTTAGIPTTVTITRISINPCITGGPTTHGQRRLTTVGDGAERPGTGTTGATSHRIPSILRPHSGSLTT